MPHQFYSHIFEFAEDETWVRNNTIFVINNTFYLYNIYITKQTNYLNNNYHFSRFIKII